MDAVKNIQDRICVDAKFAEHLASAQNDKDFLKLLHNDGYNISSDDFAAEVALTDTELGTVQGGSATVAIILFILGIGGICAGAGTGAGFSLKHLFKKK